MILLSKILLLTSGYNAINTRHWLLQTRGIDYNAIHKECYDRYGASHRKLSAWSLDDFKHMVVNDKLYDIKQEDGETKIVPNQGPTQAKDLINGKQQPPSILLDKETRWLYRIMGGRMTDQKPLGATTLTRKPKHSLTSHNLWST